MAWNNANAITYNLKDKLGLRGGLYTRASKVIIDHMWRYIITDGRAVFASLYNPQASNLASSLRTQLWLATTIVHELAHVWR
ncbi:unnamed protein product [Aureobasidium uvarum]|uniref:Uncharacterized protein n=1 Tax=Aureobasidium uvarum TaxID=2773716 RepID=A0A9N8K6X8_9PEZI|nr:unnamed protein product [Aureobasidium uvarum]